VSHPLCPDSPRCNEHSQQAEHVPGMDAYSLTIAALSFVGSAIAQKSTDASLEAAWEQIRTAYRRWRGHDPTPANVADTSDDEPLEPELVRKAEAIFGISAPLRRARMVSQVIAGAKVLWIDDHPENNAWGRALLKAFQADVTTVESTRSAVALLHQEHFDVLLSDIDREGQSDHGIQALAALHEADPIVPVVFFIRSLDRSLRTPLGAFGITNDPGELLHLILDVLERARS
jgi:CheY-like chemotaxis protein